MSRARIAAARDAGFAIAGFLVVITPALAVRWGPVHAGIGTLDADVLAASLVVGGALVVGAVGRRRYERRTGARPVHVCIASVNALVVLALSASLLLLGILYLFPDEHASIADRGYPVLVLWVGVQLAAVVLAELTAWFFLRWLREPAEGQGDDAAGDATRRAGR